MPRFRFNRPQGILSLWKKSCLILTACRNPVFFLLRFLFLFFLILTISLNLALVKITPGLFSLVGGLFTHDIIVRNVFFVPPNFFAVWDTRLLTRGPSPSPVAVIPLTLLKFSIADLYSRPHGIISQAVVFHPQIQFNSAQKFLRDNARMILKIIQLFPAESLEIAVRKSALDIDSLTGRGLAGFTGTMTIKNREMRSWGTLRLDNPNGRVRPEVTPSTQGNNDWYFRFKGQAVPQGFSFDDLIVQNTGFFMQCWGEFFKNQLTIKGFAFLRKKKSDQASPASQSVWERMMAAFWKPRAPDRDPENSTYILDIDSRMRFSFDRVTVEKFYASVNNVAVHAQGGLALTDSPSYVMGISLVPLPKNKSLFFKEFSISVSGLLNRRSVLSQGKVTVLFPQERLLKIPLEKLDLDFEGLTIVPAWQHRRAMLKHCNVSALFSGKEHQLHFDDLNFQWSQLKEHFTVFGFDSPFYEGFLKGHLWIDTGEGMRIISGVQLTDVNARDIENLLIYFSKIQGRLSSRFFMNLYPDFDLKGQAEVLQGRLDNFVFFDWLSDTFYLPGLRLLPFEKISTEFFVGKQGNAGLDKIQLSSKDVELTGYFNLDQNQIVSSKLTLSFAKQMLSESPKFRPILKVFEEDPALTFDFQLSGNQEAVNFQWLDSECKQKIQSYIPDFIEHRIEKNIDDSLNPVEIKDPIPPEVPSESR